jgi:hypothetical protein
MVGVALSDEDVGGPGVWNRNEIHVSKSVSSQDERGIVGTAHACASFCLDTYEWAGDGYALKLFCE